MLFVGWMGPIVVVPRIPSCKHSRTHVRTHARTHARAQGMKVAVGQAVDAVAGWLLLCLVPAVRPLMASQDGVRRSRSHRAQRVNVHVLDRRRGWECCRSHPRRDQAHQHLNKHRHPDAVAISTIVRDRQRQRERDRETERQRDRENVYTKHKVPGSHWLSSAHDPTAPSTTLERASAAA